MDDYRIHRHPPGPAVDDADGMIAGCQTTNLTHDLLRLAVSSRRQIRRRPSLTVNLHLDFPGAGFFRSDYRDAASSERTTPNVAGCVAHEKVIVEIAGAKIAAARPSGSNHARVVIVDPPFVVGDPQHAARNSANCSLVIPSCGSILPLGITVRLLAHPARIPNQRWSPTIPPCLPSPALSRRPAAP